MVVVRLFYIFLFVFAAVFVLCNPLFAQETLPELPAELKQKVDDLIQKLGDDKYAVREAAQTEIETLLLNTKTFDALLAYLKQQADNAQTTDIRVRLECIVGPYLRIDSFCSESELIVIAKLSGGGHWDEFDALGRPVSWGRDLGLHITIFVKGNGESEILIPESETVVKNGKRHTRTLLVLPKSPSGWYIIFVKSQQNLRAEGNVAIVAPNEESPLGTYALRELARTSLEPFIRALASPDTETRLAGIWALREINDTRAVESLIKALTDSNLEVQDAAQEALAKIGKDALDSLKAALENEKDEKIKEILRDIIDKITEE